MSSQYINQSIINDFKKKTGPFNYAKLISFLVSLNYLHQEGSAETSAILIRAILDHIPPLFGFKSFDEIVNNYPWTPSHKEYMKRLLDFKNEGDDMLHTQISNRRTHIQLNDLPAGIRINTLLEECLKKGSKEDLQTWESLRKLKTQIKPPQISISFKDESFSWQNYSVARYCWNSFLAHLHVDSCSNSKPDYITDIYLTATNDFGEPWRTNNFIFETKEPIVNEPLEIPPDKIFDIKVFVSDQAPNNIDEHRFKPGLDTDTCKLIIETRKGVPIELKVKSSWI